MLLADLVIIKLFMQLQKVENHLALNLLDLLVHLNHPLAALNPVPFQAVANQVPVVVQVAVQVHRLRKQVADQSHQVVVTNQGLFQTQSQTQVTVQIRQVIIQVHQAVVQVVLLPLGLSIIADLKDPIYQYRYLSLEEAVTLGTTDHFLGTAHRLA
jgi:hypothetical protein